MKSLSILLGLLGILSSLTQIYAKNLYWPWYACNNDHIKPEWGSPANLPVEYKDGIRQKSPETNCGLIGKFAGMRYTNNIDIVVPWNATTMKVLEEFTCAKRCTSLHRHEGPCLRKEHCDLSKRKLGCKSYAFLQNPYSERDNCVMYPDKLAHYGGVYPTDDPRETSLVTPSFVFSDLDCWQCGPRHDHDVH